MATRKTNKTAKDASKRESDFDIDKFFADMEAENRRNLPSGAIKGMPDKQPHPDMHFDINLWAWIPSNPPSTDNNDEASIGKDKPSTNEILESEEQINGISVRIVEPVNMGNDETLTQASIDKKAVQSERRCITAPGKPTQPTMSKATIGTAHHLSDLDNPIVKEGDEIPVSAPVIETSVTETHSQSKPGSSEHPTVEQSKKSRISAKKVDADFEETARKYLNVVSLGEKKPVFIPLELRNALETLARLSGVPNLAPSHIVINVLKAFFDEHRDLINRKLSGVKLSI